MGFGRDSSGRRELLNQLDRASPFLCAGIVISNGSAI